MPELPEVETIKNQLSEKLPMEVIKVYQSDQIKSILKTSEFSLRGRKIIGIRRYGKKLIFNFEHGDHLLSGLGMSGSWQFKTEKNYQPQKHDHLVLQLDFKRYLIYHDPRRFGKMHLLKEKNLNCYLSKLGIDANSPDITAEILEEKLKRYPNRPLKVNLLDQSLIAGIGNYLASEICAHARILPSRKSGEIKKREWEKILRGIRISLSSSIESSGNTFHGGYLDANGEAGEGLKNLVVFYQEICQICRKTEVTKVVLGGRGTYFCSKCQR